MMTLIAAVAVAAAQPAPATDPHGQMAPVQHKQHEGMKKDCCKECCKDMADKHGGHVSEHSEHSGH